MPMPKLPAYGDASKLEQLGSGTKQQNGTYGPMVQKAGPGRPVTGQAPKQQQQQAPQVDAAAQTSAKDAATAEWVRQYWMMMAQRYPHAWVQLYAEQADAVAGIVHREHYNNTPNFFD